MAVYGYTRVSTVEQARDDRSSLATQRDKIAAAATLGDLAGVDHIFEDAGVSGGKALADRPAGRDMLAAVKAGDTIIVAKLDRMLRDAADALTTTKAWREQGVDLIAADMGHDPVTQNGVARIFMGVLALMAEFERNRIAERLEEGRQAKAAKGGFRGGARPFGYRVVGEGREALLVEEPTEQAAIARIQALRRSGASLRAVARQVSEETGIAISHMVVKRLAD